MKSKADSRNADDHRRENAESSRDAESADRKPNTLETPFESDESSDLDESDLGDTDDRWDVFILDDDDCDPLPDYGDFWLPD
jgi:hypothetical protein